jgi:DNA mismatch repair protein MutS
VATVGDRVGFAALDLSTGEFRATEFAGESAGRRIQEELEQLRPKEMLYGSSAPLLERAEQVQLRSFAPLDVGRQLASRVPGTAPVARNSGSGWAETPLDDWIFAPDHAIPLLENHFGVLSLEGFGLAGKRGGGFGGGSDSAITSGQRSAARSITWTASASTSARIAWCSMRSRCATWS